MAGANVTIIGASVAGLSSALAFARRGARVEILERDTLVDVGPDRPMDRWWRRGVPQARHSHVCLALARRTLLTHAPDVWDALVTAGARPLPSGARCTSSGEWVPAFDDADLIGLACRRPLLESALRHCAQETPGVRFRPAAEVTGFIATDERIPRITGARTTDGDVPADLVIDASGRASGLLKWLADVGARPPIERAETCGIVYFSRFYQLLRRPDVVLNRGVASGAAGPSSMCVAIPADGDTFSVTIGLPTGDAALRAVARSPQFETAARLHPSIDPWLQPDTAEPITGIAPMAGLQNRMRRFVVDGRPIALGLLPIGDAACITDPSFGRGMALAMAHAFAVADVGGESIDDLTDLALAADDVADRLLRPWFEDAVATDRVRTAQWAGQPPAPASPAAITIGDVMVAAPHDRAVWRAALRRYNLVDPPNALFDDDGILDRVRRIVTDGVPTAPSGPSRQEMIDAMAGDAFVAAAPA